MLEIFDAAGLWMATVWMFRVLVVLFVLGLILLVLVLSCQLLSVCWRKLADHNRRRA